MKLTDIKGIGPKKAEKLLEMGIDDVTKLINYLPNRYENRSNKTLLINSIEGEKNYFELEITGAVKTYFVKKNMSISRVSAKDSSENVTLVWYNDRFSPQNLHLGQTYKFFGKFDKAKKTIVNPIFSKLDDDYIGGIYPIYSVIKGLSKKEFITFKDRLFEEIRPRKDYLPDNILEDYKIFELDEMFRVLHKPKDYFELYDAKRSYIIRQLVLEGLASQLVLKEDEKFIKFEAVDIKREIEALSFSLTKGQQNALNEIFSDMFAKRRMNRIVIGDVGSGKTIVAILSAIIAVKNGYQVAFMAPTELLASQHYQNYFDYLNNFNISSEILVGSTKALVKKDIYKRLEDGSVDIIFGTHALFQERVEFNKLGLVITDEQQRFGVHQRKLISDKGVSPDILLLSATPIPRTLALTMYKDLDLSIIEGLPSDRKPIESYLVGENYERRFLKFAYKQIADGRQVYVVCPRIEDDETSEVNSVESIYRRYKKAFKNSISIEYIHGKMDAQEKITKQKDFSEGKIDMLIATTIIEVGIDVKNANLMIIYNANQFGLSQLHQLRGRIGRGEYQSYCIFVVANDKIDDDKLVFIEKSNNGFEIAQKDLEIRGAGDRLGLYQSGFTDDNIYEVYDKNLYDSVNSIVDVLSDKKQYERNKYLKKEIENKMLEYNKVILN